ncbi:ASZ1 [Symbiodinium sp. CCMP2592]|nr:ASZ1 [Symbiodinium sp. CCMP2592]
MYAAKHGYVQAVESLVEHRAPLEQEDGDGFTALMWAARFGHPQVVETLLEHGARMEAQSPSGWTSLSLAVSFDHPEVVHALLRAHPLHDPWALDPHTGAPLWTEIKNETLRGWWEEQMSVSSLVMQSALCWETYAALCGGILAAIALVAAQGGIDKSLWHRVVYRPLHDTHSMAVEDFRQGARLIVAKAIQPKVQGAMLKSYRLLEVCSNVVFVFGTMMLQKWWVFFLPVTFVSFLGPAVFQWPLAKLSRSPALAIAVRGPSGALIALVRLGTLLALWVCNWAPMNPLLGQVMLKWSSAWAQQSLLEELPVDRQNLTGLQDDLSSLHLNVTATQGATAAILRRLDLDFIMKFFLFVTGALLAAYLASLIFQLMYTAREQFALSEDDEPTSPEEERELIRRVLRSEPESDGWPLEVAPEEACNMSMDSTYARMSLYLMDMLFDMNTIFTLVASRNFKFASALTAIVFRTVFQELVYGSPVKIREAIAASVTRGIMRNDLLNLLNEEKGFEGVLSLALTSYSFNYCVLTPGQGFTQLFSIALSAYSVASFLYEQVDLNLAEEEDQEDSTDPGQVLT